MFCLIRRAEVVTQFASIDSVMAYSTSSLLIQVTDEMADGPEATLIDRVTPVRVSIRTRGCAPRGPSETAIVRPSGEKRGSMKNPFRTVSSRRLDPLG